MFPDTVKSYKTPWCFNFVTMPKYEYLQTIAGEPSVIVLLGIFLSISREKTDCGVPPCIFLYPVSTFGII